MPDDSLWSNRRLTIQERFEAYHKEHPEVYELVKVYAAKARAAGFTRFSINMIVERIRWYHHIEQGDHEFKIDNYFRSRYARKLMEDDPTFVGFFELRVLTSP